MKRIRHIIQVCILNTLILILMISVSNAQINSEQFNKAKQLRADGKFDESLQIFQTLLQHDSTNVEYLHNTAYLLCKKGNRIKEETGRQNLFLKAEYLSRKAIALNSTSADAHYTY
ncbi:MAG: hypothetical protein JJE25_06180, partial [Bacteroidia bacterium]|nr:hypothetical protein [Bacteroidia bacterium]